MYCKKRIEGFLHFRTDLGDGVRTGIVFGECNEFCSHICDSFRFISEHEFCEDTSEKTEYSAEEMVRYLREEKTLYYARKLGITFLGREPLRDPLFCADIARGLKEIDVPLQVHTCGMCSLSAFDMMDGLVELYVLRGMLPFFTEEPTGVFNRGKQMRRIMELLDLRGTPYRVHLPILTGVSLLNLTEFAEYVSERTLLKLGVRLRCFSDICLLNFFSKCVKICQNHK